MRTSSLALCLMVVSLQSVAGEITTEPDPAATVDANAVTEAGVGASPAVAAESHETPLPAASGADDHASELSTPTAGQSGESPPTVMNDDNGTLSPLVPDEENAVPAAASVEEPKEEDRFTLIQRYAEQGDRNAQYNLGQMYRHGDGVAQDFQQAVLWYRKAAEQGDSDAQYNLGVMYEEGKGITQNIQEAALWYRKAAGQGDIAAQFNLGLLYEKGQGLAQDYREAAAWYRKAAEQGDADAQYNLGVLYEAGNGVDPDPMAAAAWYRKAAEQGNAYAQNSLGSLYENGRGVPRDYKEATAWYRKAAEQGDSYAQYNLGEIYRDGQGVAPDLVQAYVWFELAVRGGYEAAAKVRDRVASSLKMEQLQRARRLATEWQTKHGSQ